MNYDNVIIRWSKIATLLFIATVVVGDVFGIIICKYICYIWANTFEPVSLAVLSVVYYLGTVFAYVILIALYMLLRNMGKDVVFDKANTKLMTIITGALVAIAVDCVVGGFFWNGAWILSLLALFMGMVVLSVRVVFGRAIAIKEENDLTV